MTFETTMLSHLVLLLVCARVGGFLAQRLGQPAVLGELLAGLLIGPHALGWIGQPDAGLSEQFGSEEAARAALMGTYETLAQLGLILLLFYVGLETRVDDVLKVGSRAAAVAVLGVALPFGLGYLFALALGRGDVEGLFLAAALIATSTGITARALRDLGVIRSHEARIILGAAVIDDILSLILLTIVNAVGREQAVSVWGIVLLIVEATGFTAFVVLVGTHVIRNFPCHIGAAREPGDPVVLAVVICLVLAVLAAHVGLAPLVGAFLAGMVLAEAREHETIRHRLQPLYDLLAPFFFVVTGSRVDVRVFADPDQVGMTIAFTVLAILSKLVAGIVASLGLPWRSAAIIGVGMVPRGEVGLIVVSLGQTLAVVSDAAFGAVVAMTMLTTLIVPPALKRLYAGPALAPPATARVGDMDRAGRMRDMGRLLPAGPQQPARWLRPVLHHVNQRRRQRHAGPRQQPTAAGDADRLQDGTLTRHR